MCTAHLSILGGKSVKHHHCLARHVHKVPAFTVHDNGLTPLIQWCLDTAMPLQQPHWYSQHISDYSNVFWLVMQKSKY